MFKNICKWTLIVLFALYLIHVLTAANTGPDYQPIQPTETASREIQRS